MADFIVAGIIILLLCAAAMYIYKAKKRGVRCIGCASAGSCGVRHDHDDEKCSCGCCLNK